MSTSTESLISEFEKLLGPEPYFSPRRLITLGICGSPSAAAALLKRGSIPSIKISTRRTVVPKSAVLEFIRQNLKECSQPKAI